MSRFVFRLQRVLEMREQAADEAKVYLENCQKVLSELKKMLAEQRDAYLRERDELNDCLRRGEHFQYGVYEQSLEKRKSRMMELLQAIRVAETDVDIAEQHLVTCRRNLKLMENFRDRKKAEFIEAQERKDRKFMDELATLQHHRNHYENSR